MVAIEQPHQQGLKLLYANTLAITKLLNALIIKLKIIF